jgi:hypothetical protein
MYNSQQKFLLVTVFILTAFSVVAQDTASKRTIEITSSFKPVLRNAAKINFNATPPAADTAKPRLTYSIPSQNVFPGLGPVSLSPLALQADSNGAWKNSNFIKAGYGNLQTPYIQAGLSFPAGKAKFNVLADHISSNGKLEDQDYSRTNVKGFMFTPINQEVEFHASLGFSSDKYYQYGYDHTKFNYNRSDLQQRFSTVSGEAGIRNLVPTEFGLTYHPRLKVDVFGDNKNNSESNAVLDLPLEKFIGNSFGLKLGFVGDLTRFSPDKRNAINNNIFTIPVALALRTPNLKVIAGMTPSWDNGNFKLLPNFMVDVPIVGEKWIILAGWISYFNKGSYQRLASINPYLAIPRQLLNNRMIERYVGFKGTILDHLNYNAKLGYAEFRNVPLFINDTISGRSFDIVFEEQLKAVQLQGELGLVEAERFSLTARFNWYKFNSQQTENRPWGLIPLEFSTNLRWNIIKDLWLTGDFFLWDGALYKNKNGTDGRSAGAIDLNAGLEFRITKQLFLWTQFNNIFNSKYQRWNQYDNYGFNMLVGGIFRFNQ